MNINIFELAGFGLLAALIACLAYLTGRHNGEHIQSNRRVITRGNDSGEIDTNFILDNMDDGVVVIDQTGIVKLINPAAAALTGWHSAEAMGLEVGRVISLSDEHGEQYEDGRNPFIQALTSGEPIHDNRVTLVTKGTHHIPISLVISPLDQRKGGGAIGVFRDITKEREEEGARMEFISTASHEMRSPLAVIEGYLSLVLNAKNASLDSHSREYLKKAYQSTKHLGQLFRDLLTTTRADESRLDNHPEPVNMSKLLDEVLSESKQAAEAKKLSLNLLAAGDMPGSSQVLTPLYYVRADPERLKEVFRNLIDNGIKYTAAGGITIKLTGDSFVVQVQVSDSGIGIPEEDIPHLFQKFYRVDSSLTRQVGGTGLGLFICKKIVELYSGQIWIESKLGKGSTIFVNLPRLKQAEITTGQPGNPHAKIST